MASRRGRNLGGEREKGKELNGRTENSEMHIFFNHSEVLQIVSYDRYAEYDLTLKKQSDSQKSPRERKTIKLTHIGERTHLYPFLYQMATFDIRHAVKSK